MVRDRLSPSRVGGDILRSLRDTNALTQSLPRRFDVILDKVEHGDMHLNLSLTELRNFVTKLDVVANRLAFGLIVSALIVGSAILIQSGAARFTFNLFGVEVPVAQMSFLLAVLLGAWLMWSIVRSGTNK